MLLFLVTIALGQAQPSPTTEPTKPLAETKGSDKPNLGFLKLRSIGPALTSGRIVGFAVHPEDRATYYVAVACGGVWKTVNNGTTYTPVFDNEGSYSIGTVVLDPKKPNTVWVGSGENNSQRSVGYGDGVYKSTDGGRSWKNLGLKESEHIGRILLDPRDGNTAYVAAQGPLWSAGGDRGLFKTTDGGTTWTKVLHISENTGVTDVVLDPRNPDILLAAAYQRRRHVWTLINGGPESAIYRSTDAGKTWSKIRTGLPTVEMGRIGLAIAPSNPSIVYAVVEAADRKGGIFRSNDGGLTWEKRNDFDQQAQYYAQIRVDPSNAERVFVMNVRIQVSDDGGKTIRPLTERFKHVDNHELWIDPKNPNYYLCGCDGGIYESFDRAATWHFKANLPVTQFYDVAVDTNAPFYNIYGGTQDNFTLGGPARTRAVNGITNADWFVVQDGDGFHCKVDPEEPNIVYAEYQYGGLVRFDRRTGERVPIQPLPKPGEPPLRWNWDSPLLLSAHKRTRLYFAANRLYRSDDRGDSWQPISGDLTRARNRDLIPVMGKVWPPEAVSKHVSTSFYGNITALAESPTHAGVLIVGTDDGLIQLTRDDGKSWTKIDKFPGVPEFSFVARVAASRHDPNTFYAAFDNHKMGDYKPYLLKTTDSGKTWVSIAGNLPARGSVLAFVEDPVEKKLLFVGTEFGLFTTLDGGTNWLPLRAGLPTISVHDLVIQTQMDDLVVATFGRGFYVLDDISPLRILAADPTNRAEVLPPRPAWLYIQSRPLGESGKAFLGDSLYLADNPPYGATFTVHVVDPPKSKKTARLDRTKSAKEPTYPSPEELRAEAEEEPPALFLRITTPDGRIVRHVPVPTEAGRHRVTWDLRAMPAVARTGPRRGAESDTGEEESFSPGGFLVNPGTYQAQLGKRVAGETTMLGQAVPVVVKPDPLLRMTPEAWKARADFLAAVAAQQRALSRASAALTDATAKIDELQRALDLAPRAEEDLARRLRDVRQRLRALQRELRGDSFLRGRNENTPISIRERLGTLVGSQGLTLGPPTASQKEILADTTALLKKFTATVSEILDSVPTFQKEIDARTE